MALLLTIRFVLSSENKRRDREQLDESYDDVYIERIGKDGEVERVKVEKVKIFYFNNMQYWLILCNVYQEFLDLTDIQNRDFRYVL